jgi:peptidoglycan/LPS O-acetylase OafA/YrhL
LTFLCRRTGSPCSAPPRLRLRSQRRDCEKHAFALTAIASGPIGLLLLFILLLGEALFSNRLPFSATVARSDTFGSILDRHRGEGPGFGILRLGLAIAILRIHAAYLSRMPIAAAAVAPGAPHGWTGPSHVFFIFMVPAFFALSGFLVTGSALRLRATVPFLTFRLLRILPALLVEVTLSAIVLGAIFTTLPMASYFRDPQFFRYFGNIVGWIAFQLPGVFASNYVSIVNGNLWTLPAEFDCYLITAALMLTGLAYNRIALTAIMGVVTAALIGLNTFSDFAVTPEQLLPHTVTYYFFVGMLAYHWRDYVFAGWGLFALSAVGGCILLSYSHTIYLAPIFVTYFTVFLGVKALPEIKWLRTRDYSYGIYLYGYPITQALVASIPSLRGHGILVFILATACTMAFAAMSWHLIERRALALKNQLPTMMTARRMPGAVAA